MAVNNPDFELVVGIDPRASLSEMKRGLAGVIADLNNDPQKVKIQLDFSSKDFNNFKKELLGGLGEIQKLVDEVNKKQFGFNFNISDATTAQEQIAGIRAQVLDYAKALEQAQRVVIDLNNTGMKKALSEQGADLGKAIGMIMNYRTELSRIIESIDKQNTLTGLKIRRDELENLRAAIVPVLDAANKLGAVRFDMNRLIPAELPDRLQSSAEKITSIMSGLTGGAFTSGAKEQAQAIEQTAQAIQAEAQKIADASKGYDAHKIAVEAAAAAEASKARESGNVAGAVANEAAAIDKSTQASDRHTDSVKRQEDAMWKAYYAEEETAAKKEAIIDREVAKHNAAADKEEQRIEEQTRKEIAAWNAAEDAKEKAAEKAAAAKEKAAERETQAAEKAAERQKAADEKAAKAATDAEVKRQSALRQTETLIQRVERAQKEWSAAQKNSATAADYAKLSTYRDELTKIADSLRSGAPLTDEMRIKIASLNAEFAHSETVIRGAGGAVQSYFANGLTQLQSRLSYTFGFASIVLKTVAEIKKMITTATELDTAMNQLQIVTRSSSADMADYAKSVSAMAKETAQSTKDLIDATTVYARLGYSMDESSVLAKYTAMLQGVGDIEATAAQNAMTAIIKAFDKDVDDIEEVMDKLVTVGNNFPISVSQLAEGMNNAGSMLAVSGNTLEESIALLTAANTTTQNISKASTGLRTIAARIRKNYSDLEALGETIDEAEWQKMFDMLSGKGLNLTYANGEFRSTYDILKDIAGVWDDLTSMEQNTIVDIMAGTRQQNVFGSIVTQFREAENAIDAMKNSAGALDEAYQIRMQSIQAHVDTMKAAFDELSMTFINSDFAKESIDFLTSVLEILTEILGPLGKIIGFLGPLGTLGTAGGIGLLIKNFGRPQRAA